MTIQRRAMDAEAIPCNHKIYYASNDPLRERPLPIERVALRSVSGKVLGMRCTNCNAGVESFVQRPAPRPKQKMESHVLPGFEAYVQKGPK